MKRIFFGLLLILCFGGVGHAQTCGKIPFDMGLARWEVPLGNNDSGVIVGKLTHYDEEFSDAFVWTQGVVTVLPTLGGSKTVATAINASGQVIGSSTDANGRRHAVTWINGVLRQLPRLTSKGFASVSGINASGRMVGTASAADGRSHAVVWRNGKIIDLNPAIGAYESYATAINRKGQIVGNAILEPTHEGPDTYTAFLYEAGVVQFLPDLGLGEYMYASSINDLGQIAGEGRAASKALRAWLWSEGVLRDLGSFDGSASWATGINNEGQVVGTSYSGRGLRAFIWKDGLRTNLGVLPGDGESEGYAINNKGQVIGISIPDSYIEAYPWRWKRKC